MKSGVAIYWDEEDCRSRSLGWGWEITGAVLDKLSLRWTHLQLYFPKSSFGPTYKQWVTSKKQWCIVDLGHYSMIFSLFLWWTVRQHLSCQGTSNTSYPLNPGLRSLIPKEDKWICSGDGVGPPLASTPSLSEFRKICRFQLKPAYHHWQRWGKNSRTQHALLSPFPNTFTVPSPTTFLNLRAGLRWGQWSTDLKGQN